MLRFDITTEEGTVTRIKTMDAHTLTQLASTCTTRLGSMSARNAVAVPQQGSLQFR